MKTYKQILQMDYRQISKLDNQALHEAARVLQKAANQNISRIERSKKPGLYSPALESLREKHNDPNFKFSLAGLNVNQAADPKTRSKLMKVFYESYNFLSAKTSTAKGAWEYQKKVSQRLGLPNNKVLTKNESKVFWELYDKTMDLGNLAAYGSERAQQMVRDFVNGGDSSQYDLNSLWSDDNAKREANIENAAIVLNDKAIKMRWKS